MGQNLCRSLFLLEGFGLSKGVRMTINVWYSSNENKELSNLAQRPFVYKGREYSTVEQAYQCLKSGVFDEETYKKYPQQGGVKKNSREVQS